MSEQTHHQPSQPKDPERSFFDRLSKPAVVATLAALAVAAGAAKKSFAASERAATPQGIEASQSAANFAFPFSYSKLTHETLAEPNAEFLNAVITIPTNVENGATRNFYAGPSPDAQLNVKADFFDVLLASSTSCASPDHYFQIFNPRSFYVNGEDWLAFRFIPSTWPNEGLPAPTTTKNKSLQAKIENYEALNSRTYWLRADHLPKGSEVYQPKFGPLGKKHLAKGVLSVDHNGSIDNIPVVESSWTVPQLGNFVAVANCSLAPSRISDQKYLYQGKNQSLYTKITDVKKYIHSS